MFEGNETLKSSEYKIEDLVKPYEPVHEISNNVVCVTSKALGQPAHTGSLIRAFARRLNIIWILSYWMNIILNF